MTLPHPDAKIFPMLGEAELAELAADIAANGLRETLKLDPAGELLVDGRNREAACERVGVESRYERLPAGTDIFAYVVSVNLRRRHLTDEQRREIVAEIARRNPDLSNREIAKIAGVHHDTVAKARRSSGDDPPVEHKTIGADGKSRPASGQISEETRQAIIDDLKNNPLAQREVALHRGVSVGTVAGIKQRLRTAGVVPLPPRRHGRPSAAKLLRPQVSLAEEIERRKALLKPFELSREEKGMGSREYGAEQHPDYPPGWTRDHVHREKYGRIQIYTPDQVAEQELVKRFHAVVVALKTIAENGPDADDLDGISYKYRESIDLQLEKFGPRVLDLISGCLARIRKPKLTVVQP